MISQLQYIRLIDVEPRIPKLCKFAVGDDFWDPGDPPKHGRNSGGHNATTKGLSFFSVLQRSNLVVGQKPDTILLTPS
jgi:hypothetical protein